jgi:hypothetical protein
MSADIAKTAIQWQEGRRRRKVAKTFARVISGLVCKWATSTYSQRHCTVGLVGTTSKFDFSKRVAGESGNGEIDVVVKKDSQRAKLVANVNNDYVDGRNEVRTGLFLNVQKIDELEREMGEDGGTRTA